MFSQNFRVSAKSQLHNTRSKYHSAFTYVYTNPFLKMKTTDKFPKRLDFYFPPLSSQFQERILISYILLTTTLQKRKNNKIQENKKIFQTSWSKFDKNNILSLISLQFSPSYPLPLFCFLNKQRLRDSGLLLIEQAYSPRRIWISVAVACFLRALSGSAVTPNRSRRFHRTRRGAAIVALVSGSKRIHQPADYFETWKHRKSLGMERERERNIYIDIDRQREWEKPRIDRSRVSRVFSIYTSARYGCGAKSGPQCFMEIYVFHVASLCFRIETESWRAEPPGKLFIATSASSL